MKKIKALLVVVCTGVLLTACGNSSQKGVEYLEDGKYDQAIELPNGKRRITKVQEKLLRKHWKMMPKRREPSII